jgi:hypothetical protein
VPTRRRATILLLTRVTTSWRRCTVLAWAALWWLAILTSLRRVLARRRSTILTAWRRSTVLLALGRLAILTTWRGCAVLALRRLAVPLLRSTTVLARRRAITTSRRRVSLLILGVVAAVNSTEKELDDPEIGSEVDGWVSARHFDLFVFVV